MLDAGKYALKQEPVKGPSVVSMLAVEKFSPGRNVLCRFFMNNSSYERECNTVSRLPYGEQVPGAWPLKLMARAACPLTCNLPYTRQEPCTHDVTLSGGPSDCVPL